MTVGDYFLSARGRISRLEYWLGTLALIALTMGGTQFLDPQAFAQTGSGIQPPSFASTVWTLLLLWPTMAVSIKRFNDREWPIWTGYVAGLAMGVFVIANHMGYLLDANTMSAAEKPLMLAATCGFLWVLAENGLMRGTAGPNQHGHDPLER